MVELADPEAHHVAGLEADPVADHVAHHVAGLEAHQDLGNKLVDHRPDVLDQDHYLLVEKRLPRF